MRWLLLVAACSSTASSPAIVGSVFAIQNADSWSVGANFIDKPAPYAPECLHEAGSCQLFDYACAQKLPPAPDPIFHSAGTITVDGDGMQLALAPGSDRRYVSASGMGTSFHAGDSIQISAEGKELPAFSGSLLMPATATLMDLPATLPRDQDLALGWSGGSAGAQLHVLIFTDSPVRQIDCSFDAAAHAGSVPAALLGLIPAGSLAHWSANGVSNASSPATGITLQASVVASGLGVSTFN